MFVWIRSVLSSAAFVMLGYVPDTSGGSAMPGYWDW